MQKSRFAPPERILKIEPYNPGKPEAELLRELKVPRIVRMDSNENAFGPSPKAVAAMKQAAERTHRYPESGGYVLRKALSEKLRVSTDHLILGNGSTELVEIIARTYLTPHHNMVTADRTFSVYRVATIAMGALCKTAPLRDCAYDLEAILAATDQHTRIVFIANPNNPTGTIVRKRELQNFLESVSPEILVVLDEAYLEYADDPNFPNGLETLNLHSNLILLRTFSKIYGLAGMRLGFGIADPEIISHLNRIRSPYNVSVMAEAGAVAALEDTDHITKSRRMNLEERTFLEQELTRRGIPFVPSSTNFLFLPVPDAEKLGRKLQQKGVLVRPMSSFGLAVGLRVTVGTHNDNLSFLAALG